MKNEFEEKLKKLWKLDQMSRGDFKNKKISVEKIKIIDEKNQKELKSIILEIGWPKKSDFGEKAIQGAFLIAQHSFDINFQEYCLKLIKKLPRDEKNLSHVAYLEDRVLIKKGKKQKYGTQFKIDENGNKTLFPVANQKKLKSLRKSVGLDPKIEVSFL